MAGVKGNLRNMVVTMNSGKDVKDTKMLNGEATKDSLSGTNSMAEYTTSGGVEKGALGGQDKHS